MWYRLLVALIAACAGTSAQAAAYAFPGALPAGCSGSAGTYTCGTLTLATGDTVSIGASPTTITFTALTTNNAQINTAGSASALTLTVNGTLSVSAGANINANVNAVRVASTGAATYGGSITTTTDYISLGAGTRVAGALNTTTGPITLLTGTAGTYTVVGSINSGGTVTINSYNRVTGDVVGSLLSAAGNNSIGGSITATSTYVSLGGNATVVGSIYAQTYVDTGSNSNISGSITSATSYIDTGTATTVGGSLAALGTYVDIHGSATVGGSIKAKSYVSMTTNSTVSGNVTADTTVAMGSGSTVAKCVRSNGASTITVPSSTAVGGACCGSGNTCTNTCVSGSPKPAACSWPSSGLVAEYRFEQTSYNGSYAEVLDSSGNKWHGRVVGSASSTANGKFCRGLQIPQNFTTTRDALDTGIDVSAIGNAGSASFWFKAVGTGASDHRMLMDATQLSSGNFYLYRDDSGTGVDLNGHITDGGGTVRNVDKLNTMSDGVWGHVVLTWKFTTGTSATRMRLYVDGVLQDEQTYSVASGVLASAISTLYFGDNRSSSSVEINSANGTYDQIELYEGELTASDVSALYAKSPSCTPPGPHHMEVTTSSASGPTCKPVTYTIKACADAACTSLYTSGVTGNLVLSGTPTVNYTQAFSIPAGSSSTTVSAHITTAGTVTASLSAVSPAATSSPATYCGMGVAAASGGSCVYTAADSALVFDVPHHVSDVSQAITVSAVRSSDSGLVCTPAFASVSKSVNFKCAYSNPGTGTRAVRVGGAALNATNNASASCDAGGRSVSLAFDSSGVASTTVQYADAGQATVTATYTGSGSDAGLTMTGSDAFIAHPQDFAVAITSGGTRVAGTAFAGTVTARNASGVATPNFGREASPESVSLSWVRTRPTGSGAVNGSFSSTVGAFSTGVATASNLKWTEVGQGDLAAVLASANYLGTGAKPAGSTAGTWVSCASEGGTCALPSGSTATVRYGANGRYNYLTGRSGGVSCTNATFGDPITGTTKACSYVATGGTQASATGSVGPFIPHHFDVSTSQGCGSFTYSGQPFTAVITARNADGSTTQNYDGSGNTSPNHAKTTTLSAATNATFGTLSNASVALTAFASGVATATSPSFTFTNKLTAPRSITVRAVDADGVSSASYTEGSVPLRSGRLWLSNAYGSEKQSLTLPVQAQYWSSQAWVLNSADSCTTVPASAIARSGYTNHLGVSTTAWSTTPSAITISGGNGTLTLSAPSPTAQGSVYVAVNLGSTTADNACLGSHPVSTGATLSWLRALNGNCSAAADRDPSVRATFGIYSPENRRTIHRRSVF